MYYVYVLKSKTKQYYKGQTANLERRLQEHFLGKSSVTRHLRPLELIHVQLCESREEARLLEKYLKSGFGRENIKQVDEELNT
jgi:putative endonuclease